MRSPRSVGRRGPAEVWEPRPPRSLFSRVVFLQRMWWEPTLVCLRMPDGKLGRSACQLLPGLVTDRALIQPHNIHRIQLNAFDVGRSAAGRARLVWAHHIRKRGQSWVIFQVGINRILHRSILLEIVLVHNRILLCDLYFVRTRPALSKCPFVLLNDVVEHVVALTAELHL